MRYFIVSVFLVLIISPVNAQSYDKLLQLKGHSFPVYYSSGYAERAGSISARMQMAKEYHEELLGFKPEVTLLVLTEKDWSSYTDFPVYGMPHYKSDKLLIVAAHDNLFWKSFIPPMDMLPADMQMNIRSAYKIGDTLSMQPFFDLLAIHELGHAFHFQGGLTMQRKWMSELFVNILLHTYIAEKEPSQLPALTIFPSMVVAAGSKEYKFTSLNDVQERYDEIGQQYPKNYGWYQSRWHMGAGQIYDKAGASVCRKLWNAFKLQKEILPDDKLINFLEISSHKSVSDFVRNWERNRVL